MGKTGLRIVTLSFASTEELLDFVTSYGDTPEDGWLLWRTRADVQAGAALLELRCPAPLQRTVLAGELAAGDQPGTVWVRFDDREQRKIERLIAVARGLGVAAARRFPRYPVELPAEWNVEGADLRRVASTVDLSASGASLVTPEPPAEGTEIAVDVMFPSGETLRLQGKVVRRRGHSIGVAFDRRAAGTARLRSDLRRCEERGLLD